jgi:hypothetical protein
LARLTTASMRSAGMFLLRRLVVGGDVETDKDD